MTIHQVKAHIMVHTKNHSHTVQVNVIAMNQSAELMLTLALVTDL